ncbi:hypothetical protein [Pseudoalteromonas luteoviolacea]|uniref:hypothetical protein n=1 Tax=Pseudoalteromonas luteoviolacea TaxID=43657 RepID=UPI0011521307|nr:hypothetical protein [Pseudoalteromonas luteoviolacea]TQF71336.1 hypothetical protein FLM44_09670 [Pseudoalteromonas luteoviolacea]
MSTSYFSQIHVGPDGTFTPSGDHSTSRAELKKIVTEIAASNKKRLVIYCHGGLVPESSGMASAVTVNKNIRHEDHYVVSFIWETGFLEVLRDNLKDIFSSKQGARLLKWAIRAITKRLAFGTLKGGAGSGIAIQDIEEELKKAHPFKEFDSIATSFTKTKSTALDLEEDLSNFELDIQHEIEQYEFENNETEDEWYEGAPSKVRTNLSKEGLHGNQKGLGYLRVASAVVKLAWAVIKRYRNGTDHGLHATVVEEICRQYYISDAGQWVWGQMKNKAQEMWETDKVGGEFIHLLNELAPDQEVHLIGHSAGSICISHLLNKNEQLSKKLNIVNLFLLAPAARMDLFDEAIVNPSTSQHSRFKGFRMFTMTDEFEQEDTLVKAIPMLYPSSLLYFISGVLEAETASPVSGLVRHQAHSDAYNDPVFRRVEEFLSVNQRLVTSPTDDDAPEGCRSTAVSHGAFDDNSCTLSSIKYCLLNGLP